MFKDDTPTYGYCINNDKKKKQKKNIQIPNLKNSSEG